jgi:hypothetical protein
MLMLMLDANADTAGCMPAPACHGLDLPVATALLWTPAPVSAAEAVAKGAVSGVAQLRGAPADASSRIATFLLLFFFYVPGMRIDGGLLGSFI